MSINEMETKIAEMQELDRLAQEAKEAADSIRDEFKTIMLSQNTETLPAGKFIIHWTSVTTNRIDTGTLRKSFPEIAARFTKATVSRRFTVSA